MVNLGYRSYELSCSRKPHARPRRARSVTQKRILHQLAKETSIRTFRPVFMAKIEKSHGLQRRHTGGMLAKPSTRSASLKEELKPRPLCQRQSTWQNGLAPPMRGSQWRRRPRDKRTELGTAHCASDRSPHGRGRIPMAAECLNCLSGLLPQDSREVQQQKTRCT